MQLRGKEVGTGLLTLFCIGVIVVTILYLGSPGVFKPMKTYSIFFDNAAGVKPGAPVLLAGRKIGQVKRIESPVPLNERPEGHKNFEVKMTIQVAESAQVYRKVNATMRQLGLLGEQVIDFSGGDEASGEAPDHSTFIGIRQPDASEAVAKVIEMLEPVKVQLVGTLEELKGTAGNLNRMTAEGSNFDMAIQNLKTITDDNGDLQLALANVKDLTANADQLIDRVLHNGDLFQSLKNVRMATGELNATAANAKQFTDTVKREPWRLIWPSKKAYPEDVAAAKPGEPVRRAEIAVAPRKVEILPRSESTRRTRPAPTNARPVPSQTRG